MELSIFTRKLDMTPRLRDYVEGKVGRLDRYLPTIDEARIDLEVEDTRLSEDRQVAQLTVWTGGTILRAEERSSDIFTSIDAVLDKMYRQIARYKGKRLDRWHAAGEELPVEEPIDTELEAEIVRVKRFEVRPMTPEEAIEQMELLGHHFFVFMNADEGDISIVYKRRDNNYGLLQPQVS
ncbi:MAG: ribosome-associated translation inhibitor RaiA [Anaerolineae bacterium]|jgi:putative sigma-54 modulation protein